MYLLLLHSLLATPPGKFLNLCLPHKQAFVMDGIFHSTIMFLILFASCVLLTDATAVKYCDKKGDYAVKVQGVNISPNPVAPGKPANFKISASTGEPLSGGKLVLDVSYFAVHVHSETHDLCEKSSCPISAGKFMLSHSQTLPGFTPPGSYTLRMRLEGENQKLLTCFSFNFNIGFGSAGSYE